MNTSSPSRTQTKADQRWSSENNNKQEPEKSLTYDDLYHYLYRINEIKALNVEEITQQDTRKQATEIFCKLYNQFDYQCLKMHEVHSANDNHCLSKNSVLIVKKIRKFNS